MGSNHNRPLVTLIVVNFNGKGCVHHCLQAIQQQVFSDFELIVVDNGSSDGSAQWIQAHYPETRFIGLPQNEGFCRANNMAIRRSAAGFIGLLNNDAVADKYWLSRLVDALMNSPKAGFAASKMLYFHEPGIIDRAGDAYTRSGAGQLRGRGARADEFIHPEWIFGACAGAALYRKSMLETVGLFDEDFFLLYEDVDLSFRAQLQGFQCLFVPDAVVYHMASRSLRYDSPLSIYYGHRNLEWTYIKNMPNPLLWRTLPAHLLYILLSMGYFVSRGKGRPFFKAKRDALKNLKSAFIKRKQIQLGKKVSHADIWRLLEKESYHGRFFHRLNRSRERIPRCNPRGGFKKQNR